MQKDLEEFDDLLKTSMMSDPTHFMLAARTVEAMARVIPVKEGVSFTVVKTSMMSDPTHFMLAARTVEAMARVIPVKEGVSFTVLKTSLMSDPTHFMLAARTVEAMARVIPVKAIASTVLAANMKCVGSDIILVFTTVKLTLPLLE